MGDTGAHQQRKGLVHLYNDELMSQGLLLSSLDPAPASLSVDGSRSKSLIRTLRTAFPDLHCELHAWRRGLQPTAQNWHCRR
jgi:hypothetical protein